MISGRFGEAEESETSFKILVQTKKSPKDASYGLASFGLSVSRTFLQSAY